MLIVLGMSIVLLCVLGLRHLDWTARWFTKVSSINPWITRHDRSQVYVRFVTIVALSGWCLIGVVWVVVAIWAEVR